MDEVELIAVVLGAIVENLEPGTEITTLRRTPVKIRRKITEIIWVKRSRIISISIRVCQVSPY